MDRRSFVKSSVGVFAAAHVQARTVVEVDDLPSLWDVDRSIANLENGYWGVMPREIADEYVEQTRFLNRRRTSNRAWGTHCSLRTTRAPRFC